MHGLHDQRGWKAVGGDTTAAKGRLHTSSLQSNDLQGECNKNTTKNTLFGRSFVPKKFQLTSDESYHVPRNWSNVLKPSWWFLRPSFGGFSSRFPHLRDPPTLGPEAIGPASCYVGPRSARDPSLSSGQVTWS